MKNYSNKKRWQKRAVKSSLRFLLFLICVTTTTHAQANEANQKLKDITIEVKKNRLKDVLDLIEEKTNFTFFFNVKDINLNREISITYKEGPLEELLDKLLSPLNTSFEIEGNKIFLTKQKEHNSSKFALEVLRVKGRVKDPQGLGLPGAIVVEKGTENAVATDLEGYYELALTTAKPVLVISFVGYITQSIAIEGESFIETQLMEDNKKLEEIVVVGYGTQEKVNLTGAVDQITAKDITAFKSNSVGQALQGQVGNLTVATADGKPGRGATFNIRGITSINGGGPLIVIDGVPLSSTELNNLSPQDIESISVLKDAASSAIYGARASYGVILVTTKRAKKGEFSVAYSNYFGMSKAIYTPKIYNNPFDYYQIIEQEFNANISSPYFTNAQLDYAQQVYQDPSLPHAKLEMVGGKPVLLLGGKIHNYYEEWFRTYSPEQNHHLTMKGGSDKLQYFVSGDFNKEEGALAYKPDVIDRFTVRSNINYDINEKVSIFNNTAFTKRNEDLANTYLYDFNSNVWRFIENTNPLLPEKVIVDGEEVLTDAGYYREFVSNQSENKTEMHEGITTFGTDIRLLEDDLKIHADVSYQYRAQNRLRWYNYEIPYLSHSFNNDNVMRDKYIQTPNSNVYRSYWNYKRFNVNAYATYTQSYRNHQFKLMGGYNQERYDYLYTYAHHNDPMKGIPQHALNLATGDYFTEDDDDRNASQSLFFRTNYSLKNRYLIELNGSYNMSSKFPKNKKGAFFSSISAGWRVSEEAFFQPLLDVVNDLKLRVSYGSLGNQNIGSYDYIPIMRMNQSSFMLDGERVNYTGAPDPKSGNFTWETSQTIDYGVDFSLLNRRLTTSFDYYERQTKNMLANFHSLPSVYGAKVPKENIAALQTKGWELALTWRDNFKLAQKDFDYSIRVNVSDYKAKITDYYNPTNYLGDYYVGQELGEIWGLTTLGLFQSDEEALNSAVMTTSLDKNFIGAGDLKFEDVNGDGVIDKGAWTVENPGDYKKIGNTTPRYQFGVALNASWNGIDFNAFFTGVGKRDIYPGPESTSFWGPYNRRYQVLPQHIVDNRWTADNPDAYFPRPKGYIASGSNSLATAQTRYLQDASYVRLKNLTIGYTLPSKITNKIGMQRLRLYVSGQNLWTLTGLHETLDPEGLQKDPDATSGSVGIGTAYPIQTVYAMGLEINF